MIPGPPKTISPPGPPRVSAATVANQVHIGRAASLLESVQEAAAQLTSITTPLEIAIKDTYNAIEPWPPTAPGPGGRRQGRRRRTAVEQVATPVTVETPAAAETPRPACPTSTRRASHSAG